ncbi:MAG: hypothetical protein A2Y33_12545 [Spirochaetes bacterium GWF1_51_8]|nr:MAG: hypothetical protein A2Y33_12545 [Spirochaetes bacterium GWF1_51_8]
MKKLLILMALGVFSGIVFNGCAPAVTQTPDSQLIVGKWYCSKSTGSGYSYTKVTTPSITEYNADKSYINQMRGDTNSPAFLTNTGTYILDESAKKIIMYSSQTSTNSYLFLNNDLFQIIGGVTLDFTRW